MPVIVNVRPYWTALLLPGCQRLSRDHILESALRPSLLVVAKILDLLNASTFVATNLVAFTNGLLGLTRYLRILLLCIPLSKEVLCLQAPYSL
jgi:hypothetical protein